MGIKFSSFAIRGIDVSEFNGTINWSKVVNCHFSSIRVGFGRVLDAKFKVNWQGARGKVKRFPYWYMDYYSNHNPNSSANGISDTKWGQLQAETCWNAIKSDPEGVVFLDIENANPSTAPAISTVSGRAQSIAKAFLERMDTLNGKKNGIYCSLGMLNWFAAWFKNRPLWVAWYNESQTMQSVSAAVAKAGWTGRCLMWQYASDGDINDDGKADGITMGMQYKFLDLNAWLGTKAEYTAFFSGGTVVEEKPLYKVKILIYNLTVRTGPGTTYERLRRADFPGEYNIYEEKNGFGRISSTVSEWISLSPEYVKKIDPDTPEEEPEVLPFYQIKILIYNLLVRSGPGTSFPHLRRADFPGQYGVYEEKDGYGRIHPTASEWVSLSPSYVQKLDGDTAGGEEEVAAMYRVKILIHNLLVRKGPGILHAWLRRADFPGEYGIYEEKNGYGRISPTLSEWISLSANYVQRLETKSAGEIPDMDKLLKLWEAHPELH